MIAIDASDSMMTEDFSPNRLGAAKRLIDEFVSGRPMDRIGLLVFAGEAYVQCPATLDHRRLRDLLATVSPGQAGEGTALGLALVTGVNRLRRSSAPSRAMVLLTDGVNTLDEIPPLAAARLAAREGVRVYTIGVGSEGNALFPIGPFRVSVTTQIDETTMKAVAATTGGRYFRATDETALRSVFAEIDTLERMRLSDVRLGAWEDLGHLWTLAAAGTLALETALSATLLRKAP